MRAKACFLCAVLLSLLPLLPVAAQERDPTLPPARALAAADPGKVGDAAKPATPEIDSAAVVVRAGKPYLVVGTRLYGAGEKLGPYTIERVGETEVWLRNGKELRKIQRFTGIERRTSTERSTP